MIAEATAPALDVVGFAVCTALGATTRGTLEGLAAGRTALAPPPFALPFETACGAVDPGLPAPPPSLAMYDGRLVRMALQLADEIAEPFARAIRERGAERVAVVLGTSTGGLAETERAWQQQRSAGVFPAGYDLAHKHSFRAVTDALRVRFGFRGPGYVVSTACSSSAKVFGCAQRLVRAGLADTVLVGGIDTLSQITLRGFHGLGILSATPCRPFGRDRDGTSLGEGGALFVLERAGRGEARTRVLGVGESGDGYHLSAPHPDGLGAQEAMRRALAQAGIPPHEIGYVNAHGTGTPKNDLVECHAIETVLGCNVPVVSTKGYTGHALGAAGAIETAFALVALEQGWIPASLGATPLDGAVNAHIETARREVRTRYVLSNSFGFGGSNASVLLGAA